MSGIIDHILSAPPWTVLGLVALIVFVEDALFVGFVAPARPQPCSAGWPRASGTCRSPPSSPS